MPRGKKVTKLESLDVSPPDTEQAGTPPKPRRRATRVPPNQALAQHLTMIIDMLDFNNGEVDEKTLRHNTAIAVKHLADLRDKCML